MEKVVLEINANGDLIDGKGSMVWAGWRSSGYVSLGDTVEEKNDIKKIIKLKEAGFTTDEIIDMKNGGLI